METEVVHTCRAIGSQPPRHHADITLGLQVVDGEHLRELASDVQWESGELCVCVCVRWCALDSMQAMPMT